MNVLTGCDLRLIVFVPETYRPGCFKVYKDRVLILLYRVLDQLFTLMQ